PVPTTDHPLVPVAGDVDGVVRDQPVPPLDEIAHALALADAGATKEEQAHAEHVGERGVYRGSRREGVVEERLQAPVELGGLELRADHGDALVARELQQLGRRVLRLRDDDARQVEPEEGLERRAALGGAERGEVGDLRLSQHVDAMRSEALGVACEREARARRLRRRDEAVEAYVPRQGLELQGIALALKQVAHPGSGHRGSRPTARRAAATRRRFGAALPSWRRTRATARASAERWSPGSAASASMRSANARSSPCGTRNPVSPWRTDSRSPGLSEASAGVPHAAASTLEMPHPSFWLGSTTAHARRSKRRFSASGTNPR